MTAIHWTNSTGGDFADGADWSGGVVPGAGDNAVIDASGTYTVTLVSAEAVQSLVLNDRGATVSLGNGADLTLGSNLTLKAGHFDFNAGATITGGTLRAKGGKFIWNGVTLNGVTYDGPLNLSKRGSSLRIGPLGLVLAGSDGSGPGTANLSGDSQISFSGTQTVDNATINLNDSTINGGSVGDGAIITLGPNLIINDAGRGADLFGSTVVNEGTINANSSIGLFGIFRVNFTNQGTMTVSNGDLLLMGPSSFTNLASGALTGGVYEVDAGSTFEIAYKETYLPVVTDDAVITLSGAGSVIESENSAFQEVPIDATLTTIGAAGTLNLLAGRSWTSTNAVTNAGTLILGGGTFAPSALTNSGVISGGGVVGVAIANSGIIEAATGTLDLAQAITGSGTLKIDAGATLEVDKTASSRQTVRFLEGAGTLALAAPSAFAATLHGFAPTDTIDLLNTLADAATLGAGDTLVITDNGATIATLQLGGTYTGDTFAVASDGHSGTNITVTTPGAAFAHPTPSHQFIAAMAGLGGRAGGSVSVMGAVHAEDRRMALTAPRMQFA
jgi:hypothetical protein